MVTINNPPLVILFSFNDSKFLKGLCQVVIHCPGPFTFRGFSFSPGNTSCPNWLPMRLVFRGMSKLITYHLAKNTVVKIYATVIFIIHRFSQLYRAYFSFRHIRNDLSGFIEQRQDRGLKPGTIATILRDLYAFLAYLTDQDVVSFDLLRKKFRIKLPEALPRAIEPEDIRTFLSVIEKPRDRAMFLVLLRTDMRIGELLNTRMEDVHMKEKRINIIEASKTRTGRVVYLSDNAHTALNIWLKQHNPDIPYLFYSQWRNSLGYTGARSIFVKYIKKSGLAHKGYTIHCLRHTFASELLNAGMRLECLQHLLGHECIEMTRRYARLTNVTRKEEYFKAMNKIEKGVINGSYQCDSQLPAVY